jgi:hypothetical protein
MIMMPLLRQSLALAACHVSDHAGGGGSMRASLEGHALLGWPAGKVGPLPAFWDGGAHGRSRPCAPPSRRTIESGEVLERRPV